jgi:hypothetical protein
MKTFKVILSFLFATFLLISCEKETVENTPPKVNAGRDTTFQLSSAFNDTIYLSGSATDADGKVVAYEWSQVSGPNSAKVLYPASPATAVGGVVNGQYLFQLLATDDKGATGVNFVTINVSSPFVSTLVFQPNQNPMEVLLGLKGTADYSNPSFTELNAAAWTLGGQLTYERGLFKLDFNSLPAGAKIISAKLTLYSNPTPLNGNLVDANYGSNNTMLLQRVTTNWSSSVTWQSQPSTDAATQIVIPHTTQSFLNLVDIDVTNLVKDMQIYGNYGFMIKLQNEQVYNSRIFCSSRHADVTKHPKIVIQYSK